MLYKLYGTQPILISCTSRLIFKALTMILTFTTFGTPVMGSSTTSLDLVVKNIINMISLPLHSLTLSLTAMQIPILPAHLLMRMNSLPSSSKRMITMGTTSMWCG